MGELYSVGSSAVSIASLMPNGMPCSGPRARAAVERARLRESVVAIDERPRPQPLVALGDALEAG